MQDAVFVLLTALVWLGAAGPGMAAEPNESPVAEPSQEAPSAVRSAPTALAAGEIIKSIEFEGNHKFKDHVLRERLGFELGDRLDPFLAEGGRLTIMEVYRKIGYPSVEVSLDREGLAEGHLLYRINEGPRVQVANIDFIGNEAFKDGTLRQVIKTHERKWLFWPFYYTEEAVQEDLDRLRDFYYGRGFLDYKIRAETEFTEDRERVKVVFIIEEGPIYRVADIVFEGNTRFADERLRQRVELSPGAVYLKAQADRDARAIAQLYQEQGFVDARVRQSWKFTADMDNQLVNVTFAISEGRQFRIGRIDVTGNETTKDKVVRRILDEYGFTPGNLYNAKIAPKEGDGLLEKYIRRGAVAQQVMIRPVAPPAEETVVPPAGAPEAPPEIGPAVPPAAEPERKDVRIDIEEGMSGLIMPGVGFSSDSGVIGRLMFRQQNFDISDWPANLGELFSLKSFRGAGQILSVSLEPGTRYSQYYVNFIDPYWRDEPITLNVLGRNWKRFRESFDEERLKGAFEFERRFEDRWRRSLGFRVENVEVDDLDFDAPQEIRDFAGDTQLFGIKLGAGVSELDDRYDPSAGRTLSGSYEQVTGDDTFGILEGGYIHYFTLYEDVLGRKTVLATKLLAGVMAGDAPPFEKFYAGGTGRYGIRGFEYRGVSTRGLQTNVPEPELKDPIGSDWVFLAGAEVVIPLASENFGWLFFLDSGTVDTGSYRMSIGTGLEIKVPQLFGNVPMRFEIAVPLLKDDEDETQVFSFSGGSGLMY